MTHSSTPLVSVYITTQNRSELLKRAIDSVLAQTWSNVEIIVVDDASDDDTVRVLGQYNDKFTNFRWYRNKVSRGACVSRNKAIEVANGEFITGLDDDDYFLPQRVALLVEAYDDKYAFVSSTYLRKTASGSSVVKDGLGVLGLDDLLHYNKVGNQVLSRTERFRAVGGFDESLPSFQDYDMWVRLLEKFGKCLKINTPLYVFDTSHESERISSSKDKVVKGHAIFMEKHRKIMSKSHINSMQLLSKIVRNEPLSINEACRLCNSGNYKSIINNLLRRS